MYDEEFLDGAKKVGENNNVAKAAFFMRVKEQTQNKNKNELIFITKAKTF